jgi:uncharacterized protein (TIRG00374 family)
VIRTVIFALILLLAFVFITTRFTEVNQVMTTLQQGDWRWLILAAIVQLIWMLNVATSIGSLYRLMGVREKVTRLAPMAAAANFVNVVAPSLGIGGMGIFIQDGRKKRIPSGLVTTAGALYILYSYVSVLFVLAISLAVLFQHDELNSTELIASLLLLICAVGMAVLLYLSMRSPQRLSRILCWLAETANKIMRRIRQRDVLKVTHARGFAMDISSGLKRLRRSRGGLLVPFGLSLADKGWLMCILALVFMAFKIPFTAGTLVVGVGIGFLFLIISITPSGVGFVEGAMTVALHSMRIPIAQAAVATLAYRGITFWFPLAYGLVAFRHTTRQAEPKAALGPGKSSTQRTGSAAAAPRHQARGLMEKSASATEDAADPPT